MAVVADAAHERPGRSQAVLVPAWSRHRHLQAGGGPAVAPGTGSMAIPGPVGTCQSRAGPCCGRPARHGRSHDPGRPAPAADAARYVGALDHHGHRPRPSRPGAWRTAGRGAAPCLLIGAPHQAGGLVVDVLGPPQRRSAPWRPPPPMPLGALPAGHPARRRRGAGPGPPGLRGRPAPRRRSGRGQDPGTRWSCGPAPSAGRARAAGPAPRPGSARRLRPIGVLAFISCGRRAVR